MLLPPSRPHRTRREILKALRSFAAGASLMSLDLPYGFAQTAPPLGKLNFGTQTNAWPIDPKRFDTFLAALSEIREVGYQGFETGFRNLTPQFAAPQQPRRAIEQTGLTFFGVHIYLGPGLYDTATNIAPPSLYEPVARGAVSLGAKHLILSGDPAKTPADLERKIAGLDAAGRFTKTVGLRLAYHNHWAEFESKIGEIEALYTRTDPTAVSFVLDAGHAYHGGANVPDFFRRHAQRIVGLHLRDFRDGRLAALGSGTFPLAAVAAAVKQSGWSGWVENEEEREDGAKLGLEAIRPAYKAMKEAFAI